MMLRLLHMVVLAGLFLAAADVYKIKYESTLQAEKVAKLRGEIRREQDTIANLRAEWSKLDRPDRIQELAQRHLTLKAAEIVNYDPFDRLPERPIPIVPPGLADPLGALIETFVDPEAVTGSVAPGAKQ
jgi:cell division protein FtsL